MKPWRAALTSATASGKSTRIASRRAIACLSEPPSTRTCPSAAAVSSTAVFSVRVANCSRCASCTVLVDAAEEREAGGVDLHAFRHVDVHAAEDRERPDRHHVCVELGLTQVEVSAAEERQDERPARHAPAALALDPAKDRDREAL